MIKIALFLPDLTGGGAEKVGVNLAAGFLKHGRSVDLVLAKAGGPLLETLPAEVGLIDLHARRTLSAVLPLAAYLHREEPFAMIAAPDHANLIAVWAKMLARSGVRVVITNHVNATLSIRNTPKLQEKLYPFLLRTFQRRAHAIVAVSNAAADDLAHLAGIPRQRITVIHNPIVSPEIETLKTQRADHPWFGPGQPPILMGMGRLTIQKDFSTLLRAFASLRQQRPARLIILGEGEQRQELSALSKRLGIGEDVDLPGFVSNPFAYLVRSKVFVLSSIWEGFGNVLVEAMACGVPVVSTDCPSGPAEILENGRFGRLTPVGDSESLAKAILEALDHPLPARVLENRAATFSVESSAEKYLSVAGCV